MNFPDEITIPQTIVRTASEKKVWIRNIGGSCGRFSILLEHPFDVTPKKAMLVPNETMHMTFSFKPAHSGAFNSKMVVCYESGERLFIKLEAKALEANVYLEKTKLLFKDTYEGLSDQKCIKLFNRSDYVVKYMWKMHSSAEIEREVAENLKNKWKEIKECEGLRGNKLEVFDVIDFEGHKKVYDRIYCDEVDEFESNDQFLYQHRAFKIEPIVMKQ